jgi:Zn-dependent protease
MLRGGIPIGRLFGISLRLNYTWFIVFGLVTWSLTTRYFPISFPDWSLATLLVAGVVTSLLFFGSVLAHELMHSVVAQSVGIKVNSITLFIFGGVAQMSEEPHRPRDELRIALAGPLASVAIGIIFGVVYLLVEGHSEFVLAISYWLGLINISLAVFNLIPGFPLDGGRVLRSILWWRSGNLRRATKIATNIGRVVGYLFIFGGIFLIFQGLWLNGLWLALIGWFLGNAAAGSYRQVSLQGMLQGHTAGEVMTRDCPLMDPGLTIERLVNEQILVSGRRCFPVAVDGRVLGLVTLHNIRSVPRSLWPARTLRQIMTPLDKLKSVSPKEDLSTMMKTLTEAELNQVLVVENGTILGVIGRDNLLAFINIRGELGV